MGLQQQPNAHAICQSSGKARLSKGEAKSEAKRLQRLRRLLIDAYRCPGCNGWHVGKAMRRRAPLERRREL
jgi:hypothetical protein